MTTTTSGVLHSPSEACIITKAMNVANNALLLMDRNLLLNMDMECRFQLAEGCMAKVSAIFNSLRVEFNLMVKDALQIVDARGWWMRRKMSLA